MRRLLPIAVIVLAGCTTQTPEPSSSWQPAPSYRYTLTSSCGERQHFDGVVITVRNGQATTSDTSLRGLPTLEELLAEYQSARNNGAHRAKAEFDPVDGHVTRIELDPIENAIDDEACYSITDYRPNAD